MDTSLLDVNVIFVSDIIQESLLHDAYETALPLSSDGDMLEENEIREYLNGIMRTKAPALLRMLRIVLGGEDVDFVQLAARALLNNRFVSLPIFQLVTSIGFNHFQNQI